MRIRRMALLFVTVPAVAAAPPGLVLGLPLACLGDGSCSIQQYSDHDPGAGARDYRCGTRSHDGHDGTDFRLASMAEQRRGVAVLAAAAGEVRGVRDGVEDISVARIGKAAVAGRECGNGVAIVHPGGWETQYCHMARGSIAVRIGQKVTAGARLGLVGISGNSEFPHLHLSVRHEGRKVDPFAAGAADRCGENAGASLWSPAAARALAYRRASLLNSGIAGAAPDMRAIEEGDTAPPGRAAGALVYYVRLIGLRDGDRLRLALAGPDGRAVAESSSVVAGDKAQWMAFAGRRRTGAGWAAGSYVGSYRLEGRDGFVLAGEKALRVD